MQLIEVFYNEEKGKIYMVLEYCCAVLKDMLDKSPMKKFPVWQAHFYFNQLTTGSCFDFSYRGWLGVRLGAISAIAPVNFGDFHIFE